MKNRLVLALVLAGLAAGIGLLWFEDSPSINPADTGKAEQRPQVEAKEPRLLFGPGKRDAAAQISARDPGGPGAATKQAQTNRRAAAHVSASEPREPAGADHAAWDFLDDEEEPAEPEELVIGGLVQDEEGRPQPNIEVLAERIGDADGAPVVVESALEGVQSIFSDFLGAFLFRDLEDGEYRVSLAKVEGIAPAETRVRVGTLNANLVLVVLRDVRVYGTVSSTDGKPIKDVRVVADPKARSAHTGSGGEYELDVQWRGTDAMYTILFQHEGFRQQRIRISPTDLDEPAGDFQLDVVMEPLKRLTSVAGTLTDTKGNPVGGETLHLLTSHLRTWYRAQSDPRGNFRFEDIEPGKDHILRIRPASRYKNKDINPLVVPDGGLRLDIVLEPIDGGELFGWMIDQDGNPIPGFTLTLRSSMATAQSVSVVGDQQGYFSVEGFPVGGAIFRTNSYPVLLVQGIRVSAEPEEPVTVVLDIGRQLLQGRVIDRFGEPVAAASITLGWAFSHDGLRSSSTRQTASDQNGNFVFTDLGPDLHAMEVSAAGFSTAVRTVDVGPDTNEIVVELEEAY